MQGQPLQQAKVLLRVQGGPEHDWPLRLFGSSTGEGVDAVVSKESALAIINPSGALTVAYRGTKDQPPKPVRIIAVIPSPDQYVFAVHPNTELTIFEDIGRRRYPLRVSLRGQRDHCLHGMLEHICAAAGFALSDIEAWGGAVTYEGSLPYPGSAKFKKLVAGEIDAIFDEAAPGWVGQATEAGMVILPLSEVTIHRLEGMGYRRAFIKRQNYPKLSGDILTVDFSGFPIFVHAEAPDALVTQLCTALDARKHLIPWEGEGALPVERMCRDAPDTPMDVPLHPAAERFWKARGYL